MITQTMFRNRCPLRISLCDSTRLIQSSPRRLVVGGLSSVTKQQIDQLEEIFQLHPNFSRARCVQLLGHMVRSILEHADENDSMKTLSQKHQPVIICINPRLTGGGGVWRPPLPNIRDSSKTNRAIDVKLGKPSHTTIWHRPWKFFWNPSENFWDMVDFVTSLHATFGRKLAKLRGSVEDAVFNENANEKHQKT